MMELIRNLIIAMMLIFTQPATAVSYEVPAYTQSLETANESCKVQAEKIKKMGFNMGLWGFILTVTVVFSFIGAPLMTIGGFFWSIGELMYWMC